MVTTPSNSPVAKPSLPGVLSITAMEGSEGVQMTVVVQVSQTPLVHRQLAANCRVRPATTDGFAGVTLIVSSKASVTITVAVPTAPPSSAMTVVTPGLWPVTWPSVPGALLTVAMVTLPVD